MGAVVTVSGDAQRDRANDLACPTCAAEPSQPCPSGASHWPRVRAVSRSAPGVLWMQAHEEHPTDTAARRERYRELLREHGHLVDRKPGDDPNLPCGWPHRSQEDT